MIFAQLSHALSLSGICFANCTLQGGESRCFSRESIRQNSFFKMNILHAGILQSIPRLLSFYGIAVAGKSKKCKDCQFAIFLPYSDNNRNVK